jgi:hypothetical protein
MNPMFYLEKSDITINILAITSIKPLNTNPKVFKMYEVVLCNDTITIDEEERKTIQTKINLYYHSKRSGIYDKK